ncbi:hypothetical protein V6N13_013999 [Hibiscus sabdariffa]
MHSKRQKRCDSLAVIQENALTKAERKKRDRALKKMKNQAVTVEQSELEGRSLFDSDLENSWDIATKEAEKVVEMGVKLGVQFIGSMEEVIREIAELKMNESDLKEKYFFIIFHYYPCGVVILMIGFDELSFCFGAIILGLVFVCNTCMV